MEPRHPTGKGHAYLCVLRMYFQNISLTTMVCLSFRTWCTCMVVWWVTTSLTSSGSMTSQRTTGPWSRQPRASGVAPWSRPSRSSGTPRTSSERSCTSYSDTAPSTATWTLSRNSTCVSTVNEFSKCWYCTSLCLEHGRSVPFSVHRVA